MRLFPTLTNHKWREQLQSVVAASSGSPVSKTANSHDVLGFNKQTTGSEEGIVYETQAPKGSGANNIELEIACFPESTSGGDAAFDVLPYVNGVAKASVQITGTMPTADDTTKQTISGSVVSSADYSEGDMLRLEIKRADDADGGDTFPGEIRAQSMAIRTELLTS